MRKAVLLVCISLLATSGCGDNRGKAKTAADIWHIGKALEVTEGKLPPQDYVRMGVTLQGIADKWSETLGIPFDKSPTRRTK